jgi:hypothetical protein
MPIQLEDERKAGLPVVKRTALGQEFWGAVVKIEQRDRLKRDETTNEMVPVLKPSGKPRQELVITCLVLPRTTAPVGLGDDEHVPQPEEVVRLILKGKSFADWIQAKNDLGRPVNVGDVVHQKTDRAQVYDAQGQASGAEITDQATLTNVPRGKSVGIYGPIALREPKVGSEWVAKAEAAYHSLHEPITAETDAAAHAADDAQDDEPPF